MTIRQISRTELTALIETQTVELKKSLSLQREGFEALAAMINADRAKGSVLFGVAPDSSPAGVEPGDLDTAQRGLAEHARLKFEPRIELDIELFECEGKRIVVVSATRARTIPLHQYDGRVWLREGSSKRQLTLQEQSSLTSRRSRDSHPGPWRCSGCGSIAMMLVPSMHVGPHGVTKSYEHSGECKGEWWPAT